MKSIGFKPIARRDAQVLVLGSLPGRVSLEKGEYYAQAQNAFWPLMGALFSATPALPYAERAQRLIDNNIAVWDVCAAGERPGSLDSAIRLATVEINDFAAFFNAHRDIRQICLNGTKATQLYERRVLPTLASALQAIPRKSLPSTSPAHARMRFEQKLALWRAALGGVDGA